MRTNPIQLRIVRRQRSSPPSPKGPNSHPADSHVRSLVKPLTATDIDTPWDQENATPVMIPRRCIMLTLRRPFGELFGLRPGASPHFVAAIRGEFTTEARSSRRPDNNKLCVLRVSVVKNEGISQGSDTSLTVCSMAIKPTTPARTSLRRWTSRRTRTTSSSALIFRA